MTEFQRIFGLSLLIGLSACDAAGDYAVGSAAEDQIKVYDIAKKNGDKMQTCTQAMMIAQLFLQAKDEARWQEWKAKETADCKAAGMPTV